MRLKLKKLREEKGYSQRSFADLLKISKKTIQHIEQGRRFPNEPLLLKIMKALGTTDLSIFENIYKENLKRGAVNKAICSYMNSLGNGNKTYTVEIARTIKSSIEKERIARKKSNLEIQSYSEVGKLEICMRIAKIASEKLNMDITVYDVRLYKNCVRLEYQDRTGKTTWGKPEERRRNGASTRTGKFIDV